MKRKVYYIMVVIILFGLISSCFPPPPPPPHGEVKDFDTWFDEVMKDIIYTLRHNTFIKDRPFIIVKARGEDVLSEIDPFTEEMRERMISQFLMYPDIGIVRRHPVHVFDRPYSVQELRCGRFTDYKMLMTLDLRPLDEQAKVVRISIRAIDRNNNTWARGFSFYGKVRLSEAGWQQFKAPKAPDQHLKGLKYVPFERDEKDEMAAYLARNITCISLALLSSENNRVYIDQSGLRRELKDIVWFIKRQLQFCNLIEAVSYTHLTLPTKA